MSLLSKLFGGKTDEVADMLKKEAVKAVKEAAALKREADAQRKAEAPARAARPLEQGLSWGEVMPDEPNQYNFKGTHTEYFEDIFRAEFPGMALNREIVNGGRSIVYTLGQKELVVELMTEKSAANKRRRDCLQQGVPYLRFYYDHEGWWNTRKYVVDRLHAAMGR